MKANNHNEYLLRFLCFVLTVMRALTLSLSSCQKAPELSITGLTNVEISPDGGSAIISFSTNRDWAISWSDPWISVSSSSGSGSKNPITISISCIANPTYDDRSGIVTIKAEDLTQTVTVKQLMKLGLIVLTQSFDIQSGAKTIEVEVQSNIQYTVDIADSWIKQTGTKGLTSKKLVFSIAENTSYDAREGKITIKPATDAKGIQEQVVSVKQAQKDALVIKDSYFDMPYGGGGIEVKVESNVEFDGNPVVDWIHYVETKALGSSTVCLTIDENTTYSPREGKVEIRQKNGNLSHTVIVKQNGRIAVASIELNKTKLSMVEGDSVTLVASVKPENTTNKVISWTSSNSSVVDVNDVGEVLAVSDGEAAITAKATDGSGVYATCSVKVKCYVSSITLNKTDLELYTGSSYTLTAIVLPSKASDKTLTWESSNESIATVSKGVVTAIKAGQASILVKANDGSGVTSSCNLVVKQYVTSILLNQNGISCLPGKECQLSATVLPDDANNKAITWSSSNDAVATVDNSGKVIAKAIGTSEIMVSAQDGGGTESVCVIHVWKAPEAIDLGLSVKWASWNIGASTSSEGEDYFAWGEVLGSGDGKNNFDFYSYKWYEGQKTETPGLESEVIPRYNYDSAYGPVDNLDVLKPEDDVASTKLGSSWRMPTKAEFEELRNRCVWVWTTENGIAGMRITSKVSGHTDKSIFLPGAGNIVNTTYQSVGEHGSYWSSNLDHFTSYQAPYGAICIHFSGSYYFLQGSNRSCGFTIRAVTD